MATTITPIGNRWCRYDPASPCRARTAGWSGRRVLAVLGIASWLDRDVLWRGQALLDEPGLKSGGGAVLQVT
jgi:hypothetical protein